MPVPVHVPRSPVSTVPAMGLPMIDGACVLGGPAADAARTDPPRTASATTPATPTTPTTPPPIQRDLVAELRFGMTPPFCPSRRERRSTAPLGSACNRSVLARCAGLPHPHRVSGPARRHVTG